jgi:carboxypeptidase Taq
MTTSYEDLIARTKDASLLRSTMSVLGWDQRTKMPKGGVGHRALQLSQLAGMVHERSTDPKIGELLDACEADASLDDGAKANVREIRHGYDRGTKLPTSLVQERSKVSTIAEQAWEEARSKDDFSLFAPHLAKNIELARKVAECFGWESDEEPWDALAESYERGMRARDIEAVFTPLRDRLQALVSDLMSGSKRPSTATSELRLPVSQQRDVVKTFASAIGFDFDRGRIDTTVHPFCSGTNPGDVRITTRFSEDKFFDALLATMHETGHGIYEQGLLPEHTGTPLGRAVSLGIHESQSRMWENFVGRSRQFWTWGFPQLQKAFGDGVSHLSADDVYEGVNTVEPSFIRVEADEGTYNLHIMIRFELERVLMNGELDSADLPHEWNRRYKEYLGVDVPNDTLGCLQDVHWSGGSFGYFPTYTLGNLYAAQLFETILEQIPNLHDQFAQGEFGALKTWLNENLHQHGARYLSAELCERVTGKPLSSDPLLRHLESKLRPLYGA